VVCGLVLVLASSVVWHGKAMVTVALAAALVTAGAAAWSWTCLRARSTRSVVAPTDDDLLFRASWFDRSPAPVALLPTSVLGGEWLRSTAALPRLQPADRPAAVRRRQEVLDELERRDPVASHAGWPREHP
jgi:hypothetical protein